MSYDKPWLRPRSRVPPVCESQFWYENNDGLSPLVQTVTSFRLGNQSTINPSALWPPNQTAPSAPLPPRSEWKGIHPVLNVNQPDAAVLLWCTQADQHLTENFLIALWSCSINSLARDIICPVSSLFTGTLLCAAPASQGNHSYCFGSFGEFECSWFIV